VKRIRHKFGAVRTTRGDRTYASKAEARYAGQLELRKAAGDVVFFLWQVPFHLPGGVKYVADFLVFEASGDVRVIDVKGHETEMFRAKKRMVEALYPVTVEVVK
jgi:hypothetical protein